MNTGLQEWLALAIVALVVVAVLFRRIRSRRCKKGAREASISADRISRRH